MSPAENPDPTWFTRPAARDWSCSALDPHREAARFHRELPGYRPTPLLERAEFAAELGVGRVFVKDESQRFDLGAFKILGASWAAARALIEREQAPPGGTGLADLHQLVADRPATLVTATDGNHGRAVARMARLVGAAAHIVVPDVVAPDAVERIAAEGATVSVVAGSYDEAVDRACTVADRTPDGLLIQDTAWPGYDRVPAWIVQGYSTLLTEIDDQLDAAGAGGCDLIAVPVGVGSLAQAVVAHHRSAERDPARRPIVLSVEPDTAACVLASLQAGHSVSVPTAETIMAGLNCGTVSALAWPVLAGGLDAAVAVTDGEARRAVSDLAAAGISSGPSGASALAGVRAALDGSASAARRSGLTPRRARSLDDGVIVLLSTEGRHR